MARGLYFPSSLDVNPLASSSITVLLLIAHHHLGGGHL
jgi:hypothetical protein